MCVEAVRRGTRDMAGDVLDCHRLESNVLPSIGKPTSMPRSPPKETPRLRENLWVSTAQAGCPQKTEACGA